MKPFIVNAGVTKSGKHSGARVIRVLNKRNRKTSAYIFECCWGFHTNCYGEGTRIGMYCTALDNYITDN
jgi:hypothetical protein